MLPTGIFTFTYLLFHINLVGHSELQFLCCNTCCRSNVAELNTWKRLKIKNKLKSFVSYFILSTSTGKCSPRGKCGSNFSLFLVPPLFFNDQITENKIFDYSLSFLLVPNVPKHPFNLIFELVYSSMFLFLECCWWLGKIFKCRTVDGSMFSLVLIAQWKSVCVAEQICLDILLTSCLQI